MVRPVQDKVPLTETVDEMLPLLVRQGYVPSTCLLPGMLVFHLVNSGKDPCFGRDHDRSICKGRHKEAVNEA
jgi:hypothetical protein